MPFGSDKGKPAGPCGVHADNVARQNFSANFPRFLLGFQFAWTLWANFEFGEAGKWNDEDRRNGRRTP
jgi:hypothetical protein